MKKHTNALIHESSPYLLQHAHNPVNWVSWSDEIFAGAKSQNKMVLVSVGYSACHWCHVMEHECFEDEEVAALMNKYFVCIKVDREERPDVDQVYMTAVQLMTQKGGWPLNCFTLADGRPIYGGTYFPKEQWLHILRSLQHTFENDREKVEEYANHLHEGVKNSELISEPKIIEQFSEEKLHELVLRWSRNFDSMEGGDSRAPKFPLPNNYEFLLHYGVKYENQKVLNHVELTLDKMVLGGIYDQVGGGFTRYSVDMLWKVPHFEKMLYDNGQLLSLYSEAYKYFKKPLYKRVVYQTIEWLEREMSTNEGAFYSALDADSEGDEGKFYCWNKAEMKDVLGDDFEWVSDFYNLNQRGYWEENKYIPLRTESDLSFAGKMKWTMDEFEERILTINQKLLDERTHRILPGTDDKCLTSWNALTIKGLCDAYSAFGEEEFLHLAIKVARWILKSQMSVDGKLFRTYKNGKSTIDGFLEDYTHVISAFIELYQVTFDSFWLDQASKLTEITLKEFHDEKSEMFFFTSNSTQLIARKMELNDNVLPASNSVMAHNLFRLSNLFYNNSYKKIAEQMLSNVYEGMEMYGSGYSNWGSLLLNLVNDYYQLAIIGNDYQKLNIKLQENYLPNVIFAGGLDLNIPMLADKKIQKDSLMYVCKEGTCLLPSEKLEDILRLVIQ
ncbi:MAG: hypothetical protein RI883_1225 [Bacteroidota bacterium]|jgi:uncharacterized protein YyaL (SSP411 family)